MMDIFRLFLLLLGGTFLAVIFFKTVIEIGWRNLAMLLIASAVAAFMLHFLGFYVVMPQIGLR